MTVTQEVKPEPRVGTINTILARVAEISVEANLTPDEMGILSLCLIQVMLEHCIRTKVDCPSRLGITTPKGYKIGYQIEKPVQDPLAGLQQLADGMKTNGQV